MRNSNYAVLTDCEKCETENEAARLRSLSDNDLLEVFHMSQKQIDEINQKVIYIKEYLDSSSMDDNASGIEKLLRAARHGEIPSVDQNVFTDLLEYAERNNLVDIEHAWKFIK